VAQIESLPKPDREHVLNFIFSRLPRLSNPRRHGKPLADEFAGFWRYRIDQYRIICTIDDTRAVVQIVRVGHRYDVYRPG
jgi:mRNA interferase RelE/StbE